MISNHVVVNYDAPPTIQDFMLDDAKVRLLMGPYGSGKTTGCIMELMRRAMMEYPDANGRKTHTLRRCSEYGPTASTDDSGRYPQMVTASHELFCDGLDSEVSILASNTGKD